MKPHESTHHRVVRAVRWGTATARYGTKSLVNLIFPPTCQLCTQDLDMPDEVQICAACRWQLRSRRPLCPACAMPLPNLMTTSDGSCPACHGEQFRFAGVQVVGLYTGLLRDTVLRMKKAHEEALTLTMGRLLAAAVEFSVSDDNFRQENLRQENGSKIMSLPDLVVPVPMHWTRRMTRGTNPPEVLAEMVGQKLKVPVIVDLLKNRRKTRKQGTLLPDQRRQNVRQAFAVSAGYDIKDATVLLIDDVMTTGATSNELSKLLRRTGAKQVSVAVLARGTG